jgi:hypothetical protein
MFPIVAAGSSTGAGEAGVGVLMERELHRSNAMICFIEMPINAQLKLNRLYSTFHHIALLSSLYFSL